MTFEKLSELVAKRYTHTGWYASKDAPEVIFERYIEWEPYTSSLDSAQYEQITAELMSIEDPSQTYCVTYSPKQHKFTDLWYKPSEAKKFGDPKRRLITNWIREGSESFTSYDSDRTSEIVNRLLVAIMLGEDKLNPQLKEAMLSAISGFQDQE